MIDHTAAIASRDSGCHQCWPIKYHTSFGVEHTRPPCNPKWWRPRHPRRKKYFFLRHPAWSDPWEMPWIYGWASSPAHQAVKRAATRRFRQASRRALRAGHDDLPRTSVDWVY